MNSVLSKKSETNATDAATKLLRFFVRISDEGIDRTIFLHLLFIHFSSSLLMAMDLLFISKKEKRG